MPTEIKAQNTTTLASVKAIYDAADQANTLLDGMQAAATAAGTTLDGIYQDAADAQTAADDAQASADNASEYAARALGNLSTVQNITETLNWITAHGTMTLTSDVALDPTHVYFVVDPAGDYVVGGTHYSVVTEPDVDDISTYYELSINESLNNYVATHLAVDSEGLWIIPDAGGNKVLIATGSGSTYTTAGTYIVGKVGGVDTVFAKFLSSGATMQAENGTTIAHLGYGPGKNSVGGTSDAPYYTLGTRDTGAVIGNLSISEGSATAASAYTSHAEGYYTRSSGNGSHAEGYGDQVLYDYDYSIQATGIGAHAEGYAGINGAGRPILASGNGSHAEGYASSGGVTASGTGAHAEGTGTTASGNFSHAEGSSTTAVGSSSHAQNYATKAGYNYQTAIGQYNDNQSTSAFEIGNGTADNARSNALTVDWSGNIDIASGAKYKINGTALSASDVGALAEDANGDISITRNITAGGSVDIASGESYKINGTALAAADVGAASSSDMTTVQEVLSTYGTLLTLSSSQTLTTSAAKMALNTFTGSGCSKSSNGIKVTKAGLYQINGMAYLTTGFTANDIIHLMIRQNTTTIAEAVWRTPAAAPYETLYVGPMIVSASASDVFYLYVYNQTGGRGTAATKTDAGLVLNRLN